MKLQLSQQLQAIIQQILLVESHHCTMGIGCPANKIKDLADAPSLLGSERDFLKSVMTVQEDGRSCPASDMQLELRKFLCEDWRYDRWAVTIGIRFSVVVLDDSDIARLSGVRPAH